VKSLYLRIKPCLLAMFFLSLSFSAIEAETNARHPMKALWPSPDPPPKALHHLPDETGKEDYILRSGGVDLAVDYFLPRISEKEDPASPVAFFRGRILSVSFFPDKHYDIAIDSESRPKDNILSLIGHIEGQELAGFTMTITDESYLLRLRDFDASIIYRVVGDTRTGAGRVSEIDLRKMPPIEYQPPLVPEKH